MCHEGSVEILLERTDCDCQGGKSQVWDTERIWMSQSGIRHFLPVCNWYCPESLKRDLEERAQWERVCGETRETWGESRDSEETSIKILERKWGDYGNTLGETERTPHHYPQPTHSRARNATLTHLTSLPDHVVSHAGQGSYVRNHYSDKPSFSPGLHKLSCRTGRSCYSLLTSHISMTRVHTYPWLECFGIRLHLVSALSIWS